MRNLILAVLGATAFLPASGAAASGPGFDPRVVTFGDTRDQLKATPMVNRPYRPLHFYGNTVRRRHYREQDGARAANSR